MLMLLVLAIVTLCATGSPVAAQASAPGPVAPDDPAPQTAAPHAPAPAAAGYSWPLRPAPPVEVPFREPTHLFGPGHRGVDLAAPVGAPVRAAAAGTVVFAGVLAGRGVVSVQHADGLRTTGS